MTPRVKALVVVLALVAAAFAWQRLRSGGGPAPQARGADPGARLEAAGGAGRARRPGRGREEAPVREVVELRVADLQAGGGEYHPGRNPFSFSAPPPPPPPPGPTAEELAQRRAAEEAARRAAEEAARLAAERAADAGPQPPSIDFTYLGSFGPAQRRIAVFSDGEGLYNVLTGDVVKADFRLVHIGLESVELEYVDFPELPPARLPVGAEGT